MGNPISPTGDVSKTSKGLPIETQFKLPSPLPSWPPGEGFASGTIDLGGLQVRQISTFSKVWATHEGGPDNLGASFFEPSQIPTGFFTLGCYSQANNRLLHGWVLVAKDKEGSATLEKPIDYTLVWSSESLKISQDGIGYIWLPTPPDGYRAVGHVVTTSSEKPSPERVRCIRSDLIEHCDIESWIWGPGKESDPNGFNIFSLTPSNRGIQAMGVPTGTFLARNGAGSISLVCLKNLGSNISCMPNPSQIQALFQTYSPWIYLHPDEQYLPSSVSWYFVNGALLYTKGQESNPIPIEAGGSNLPQGGSNDDAFWIDLPVDEGSKERVKKGDLNDSEVYLQVKPMLGATFTDIAIWIFYPFNGPAKAKASFINIPLGRIGEHVGDWEHLTLRVSNFTGELWSLYFSQHSGGDWIEAQDLEFQDGNKPVTYASLHGHAMYSKPGLVLQGSGGFGIRNDTAKSKLVMDTGARFSIVAAEYLGKTISEPSWLNYYRKWGPKISYDIAHELKDIEKILPGKLKSTFEKFVKRLPSEVLGEDGPTGPKLKRSWDGDEVVA
ncbi:hypothetical protein K2173_015328 [Erythroxylum novogranatense]|uniref:Vacuolar protein sorting-associated protein 62 n=1 Tax=Erythroxylum novogranatense TaxID=1862640 RepID=A0AAV8SS43_9ROSI|nr:hypothetical protein K2173_015328 [Erythroxylum novogranatense]